MAYQSNLLTNGEHDELWRRAFTAVPRIVASLQRSNGIECAKELHACGKLDDEAYCRFLIYVVKEEGFIWSEGDEN